MRRPHLSLAWKMTALFALFGVFITYASLVLVGSLATAALVGSAGGVIKSMASSLMPDRSSAFIEGLHGNRDLALGKVFRAGNGISMGDGGLETLSLLTKPATGDGLWCRISVDGRGGMALIPLDPGESARIDSRVFPGAASRLPPYLGRQDRITFFVDLSRPGDDWLLAAELGLARHLALSELRRMAVVVVPALVLWLAFVLGLSQLFGRSLARPVRGLAAWSQDRKGAIALKDLARGDELGSLARSLLVMRNEIADEGRELADRAKALETMNRIDRAVLAGEERSVLLGKVLEAVLDYDEAELAAILARDPDGGGFSILAVDGASLVPGRPGGFIADDDIPESILIRFSDRFEVALSDLGRASASLLSGLGAEEMDGLRFSSLPFAAGDGGGFLVLVRRGGGADLARLGLLADQAGVALRSLDQRAASERNWLAVVTSLVRAVDAKSAWTRGHSERVAVLAKALGRRLLMEGAELAELEFAAVLNDVGKIGVPEAILDKPGRLSDGEMDQIRRHPVTGAGIVEDIPAYRELRPAILYHHERWDGSGYPEGLSGEAIPLGARIIASPTSTTPSPMSGPTATAWPLRRPRPSSRPRRGASSIPASPGSSWSSSREAWPRPEGADRLTLTLCDPFPYIFSDNTPH